MTLPWTIMCTRKCFAFAQDRHLDGIFLCLFHYSVRNFLFRHLYCCFTSPEVKNILILYSTGILIAQEGGKY